MAISSAPIGAVGETLQIAVTTIDGTAGFDSASGPGLDQGPNNDIIRTNDVLTYVVEIAVEDAAATNVQFSLALPQGLEASTLPAFCLSGSSVTPELDAPVVPVTATSWTALSVQTVVCVVGDRVAGSTASYQISAVVRPEVPNAEVLAGADGVATSDDATASTSSSAVTVSAAPAFDVSLNSTSEIEDTGYFNNKGIVACSDGSGRVCTQYGIPITISAKGAGKGSAPLASPVTFTIDLAPAALYAGGVESDSDYVAAGTSADAMYGGIIAGCLTGSWRQPHNGLSEDDATVDNSVRDSGTTTCTQSEPGGEVTVSISGMDSTAYTVPTLAGTPEAYTLPANRGYVYSGRIRFEIPMDAVVDLGALAASGSSWSLGWSAAAENFTALGVDSTPNIASAQEVFNDYRASSLVASSTGSASSFFLGVPGTTGNVPPDIFRPGWSVVEGPAGSTGTNSGDGQVYPGQNIVTASQFKSASGTMGSDISFLGCNGWDPTLLQLEADDYPASQKSAQDIPSGGEPVWISGYLARGTADSSWMPELTVEYGDGVAGAGMTCDDGDSPGGWHSDPADVPGNDAALAQDGVFDAVSMVRFHFVIPPHVEGNANYLWVSIGQRSTPGLATGTIIGEHFATKVLHETMTYAQALASTSTWSINDYDPSDNSGTNGDRVRAGGIIVRVSEQVAAPGTSDYGSTVVAATGGSEVDFRLSPTLTAGVQFDLSVDVSVENCLAAGQIYVSSSLTPSVVQDGAPSGSDLACPPGQTYLRFDIVGQQVNSVITPIDYRVRIAATVSSGVQTNDVLITTADDTSSSSARSDQAQVNVQQPAGIVIEKASLTPLGDVNRAGETNPSDLRWAWTLANIGTDPGPTDIDVIDVLPSNGLFDSDFSGTISFDSATIVAGGPAAELLYTAQDPANLSLDPDDASNDETTGATVWCDSPSGGAVVLGSGVSGDCPASPAQVSGMRVRRAGAFGSGEEISVETVMTPIANVDGDVYDNRVEARAVGLAFAVGPVSSTSQVVGGEVGDKVWNDLDGDGIQDPGESGVASVSVELTGTDADGNSISETTQTDTNGEYQFTNLPAAAYTVDFSLPVGGTASPVYAIRDAGSDDDVDSDGDRVNGITVFALGRDEARDDIDQGIIYPTPAISLVKQLNADDAATSPGITVVLGSTMAVTYLVTNTGNLALNAVTVSDDVVATGDISCPQTTLALGESMTCTAQYPAPASGQIHHSVGTVNATPVLLPNGVQPGDVSAQDDVYASPAESAISGVVWVDVDEDTVVDAAEVRLGGVAIELYDSNDDLVATTTTASDGSYVFTGMGLGQYVIRESQPDGYGSTTANEIAITLTLDGSNNNDFGERPGSIRGIVWTDSDGDGLQAMSETRLPGVTVKLLDSSGSVVATTTADSSGSYLFDGLLAGTYKVEVVYSQAPFTTTSVGTDIAIDSDVDWHTGRTESIVLSVQTCSGCLESVTHVANIDAGVVPEGINVLIDKSVVTTTAVSVGQQVLWNIDVKNNGLAPVAELVVRNVLPAGLKFVSASGTGWTCTKTNEVISSRTSEVITCVMPGDLLVGYSTPTIRVVTKAVSSGSITNVATVRVASGTEVKLSDNTDKATISIQGQSTLSRTGGGGTVGFVGLVLLLAGLLLSRSGRRPVFSGAGG